MRRMITDKDTKKLKYITLRNHDEEFDINNVNIRLGTIENNISKTAIALTNSNGTVELSAEGAYIMTGYYSDDIGDYLYQIQIGEEGIQLQTLDEDSGDYVSRLTVNANGNIITILPTSDPKIEGALWNDNGTLKVSAGK